MPIEVSIDRRVLILAVLCATAGAVTGCRQAPADLFDPAVQAPAELPAFYDDRTWASVLRDNVKSRRVDYNHLAQRPETLQAYLDHVIFVGPNSTPNFFKDPLARLAYYLNVYNAAVLKAVISAGIPETMHDARGAGIERHYRFKVDGTVVTLAQLREWARVEGAGDARLEFAMCDAALGSPPLLAQPFRPYNLRDRLRRLAQEAMDNPAMVRVDHEGQRLLVGLPIWTQRAAFQSQYCRETASKSATMLNCLMHLASGIRRQHLSRAAGYDVRLLPFGRPLNTWRPNEPG